MAPFVSKVRTDPAAGVAKIAGIDAGKPQRQRCHQICEGIHAGILGPVWSAPNAVAFAENALPSEPQEPSAPERPVGVELTEKLNQLGYALDET